MVRAFTAADVVQHATGTYDPPAIDLPATVSLPGTTSEGTGGLIVMGAMSAVDPPNQWHQVSWAGNVETSPLMSVMVRADFLAGEQSWEFMPSPGSGPSWAWVVEEWTNLSYAPLLAQSHTNLVSGPASLSTGTTPTWSAPYAVGIAAITIIGGVNAQVWSPVTWSNSFTETDVVTLGAGNTSGADNLQLRVARRYGTLDETGGWETTITFTNGADAGKVCYACLAVLRAENKQGDI